MVGYRYIVKLRVSAKNWYPDQGGSEDETNPWTSKKRYDMVCPERGLPACHRMVEELLTQDYGVQGVHDGRGHSRCYVVDLVEYKGEVRLLDGDGK